MGSVKAHHTRREQEKNKVPDNTKCERCGEITQNKSKYGTARWVKTPTGYLCWKCHIIESNENRIYTDETRKKISVWQKGVKKEYLSVAGKKYFETHEAHFKGQTHTPEARALLKEKRKNRKPNTPEMNKAIGDQLRGEKSWRWKGGITELYTRIRTCPEYRLWRLAVFRKDNFTCQGCGDRSGGNLVAHHVKYFSLIMEQNGIKTLEEAQQCKELWDIHNGLTVCEICHDKIHRSGAEL